MNLYRLSTTCIYKYILSINIVTSACFIVILSLFSVYKVGSKEENVWSDVFTFYAMRNDSDWSPSIALYGDFGFSNHQSLQKLIADNEKRMYDAVFHVGK